MRVNIELAEQDVLRQLKKYIRVFFAHHQGYHNRYYFGTAQAED